MNFSDMFHKECDGNAYLNIINYSSEYVEWLEAKLGVLLNPPKSEDIEPPNSTPLAEQQLKAEIAKIVNFCDTEYCAGREIDFESVVNSLRQLSVV